MVVAVFTGMDWKNLLKKTWHFIWVEDSVASWIVNVILAFILIKFLVYPGLGLILGTTHPVVAVVSGSMEHDGSFDDWWVSQQNFYNGFGVTEGQFQGFDFRNGFNTGDIMILTGTSLDKVKIGQVIVYMGSRPDPIIHRVVKIFQQGGQTYLQTKGDHNTAQNPDERMISGQQIIGKAAFRVPWLGWIKIAFVDLIKLVIP